MKQPLPASVPNVSSWPILLKNSTVWISTKTNLHESCVKRKLRDQTSSNSTLVDGIWLPKAFRDEATEFFNRIGHDPPIAVSLATGSFMRTRDIPASGSSEWQIASRSDWGWRQEST